MATIEPLRRFVAAASREWPSSRGTDPSQRPFVTVSREAGAGGRSMTEALIRLFQDPKSGPLFSGWRVYDREICEMIAGDPRLRVSMSALLDEEFHSEFEDFLLRTIADRSPQTEVFKKLFETIRGLATIGRAVIVGRGGVHLTRDLPCGVHVRLVASMESRIARTRARYGLDEKGAKAKIAELEAARSRLFRNYFDRGIADPLLYDAVFNTDAMPLEAVASAIRTLVFDKAAAFRAREPAEAPR